MCLGTAPEVVAVEAGAVEAAIVGPVVGVVVAVAIGACFAACVAAYDAIAFEPALEVAC